MRSERLYLIDILEASDAIARFIHGRTLKEFMTDDYFQSAVITKFSIIGESSGRLSDELRQRYPDVPWQKARRLRNVAVHAYFAIDWNVVWNAAVEDVPALRAQIAAILETEYPEDKS
jgi:uncharacterized protein with HEPN domain